jgi:hypothetical protein
METLPSDLIKIIIFELSIWDIWTLRRVCKHFRIAVDNSGYWEKKITEDFPQTSNIRLNTPILVKIYLMHMVNFSGYFFNRGKSSHTEFNFLRIAQDPRNMRKGIFFASLSRPQENSNEHWSFSFGGDFVVDPLFSHYLPTKSQLFSCSLNIRYERCAQLRLPRNRLLQHDIVHEWKRICKNQISKLTISTKTDGLVAAISRIDSGTEEEDGGYNNYAMSNPEWFYFLHSAAQTSLEGTKEQLRSMALGRELGPRPNGNEYLQLDRCLVKDQQTVYIEEILRKRLEGGHKLLSEIELFVGDIIEKNLLINFHLVQECVERLRPNEKLEIKIEHHNDSNVTKFIKKFTRYFQK